MSLGCRLQAFCWKTWRRLESFDNHDPSNELDASGTVGVVHVPSRLRTMRLRAVLRCILTVHQGQFQLNAVVDNFGRDPPAGAALQVNQSIIRHGFERT